MPESRLVHTPLKIGQLIQDYRSGKIVIPEFQREYVWKKSKASRLVDSLYRGFPNFLSSVVDKHGIHADAAPHFAESTIP